MFGAMLIALSALGAAPSSAKEKPEVEHSSDPLDKMICKRFAETGSLVATTKVCKTKREWDIAREELRRNVTPGNCPGGASGGTCG